jgi:quinol monooxygenase YgiN
MYGTIARLSVQPGKLEQLRQQNRLVAEELVTAGIAFEHIFQADGNEHEVWIVVGFTSREAYRKNAESPEQHARYQQLRAMLTADPEWHDGEVIDSFPG